METYCRLCLLIPKIRMNTLVIIKSNKFRGMRQTDRGELPRHISGVVGSNRTTRSSKGGIGTGESILNTLFIYHFKRYNLPIPSSMGYLHITST